MACVDSQADAPNVDPRITQNRKLQCEAAFPAAVLRIPLGADPLSSIVDGQPSSTGDTYILTVSNNYVDASCIAGAQALAAEDAQQGAIASIFQQVPGFMDTADARGLLSSLTPCERLALAADVVKYHDEIAQATEAQYLSYKAAFDQIAITAAVALQQNDPETVRQEFNKAVTEYWYRNVVDSGPVYVALEE